MRGGGSTFILINIIHKRDGKSFEGVLFENLFLLLFSNSTGTPRKEIDNYS